MGLLDGLKKKAPEPEKVRTIYQVNLPKTSARTDIGDEEQGTYFPGCHLWIEGDKLRAFQGGKLIFEVTKKSKAFAELEPLVGKQLQHIVIRKKYGDYGLYYMASVAIEE